MPRFKLGARFLLNAQTNRFSTCDAECCGTPPPVRCIAKYNECDPATVPCADIPMSIWVPDSALPQPTPPPAFCTERFPVKVYYAGLCWALGEVRDLAIHDPPPPGSTIVMSGVVPSDIPCYDNQGRFIDDANCGDRTLFLLTEPCACNPVPPPHNIYVCRRTIVGCTTGIVLGRDRQYCVTARPGPGVRQDWIAANDPSAELVALIFQSGPTEAEGKCCGCCHFIQPQGGTVCDTGTMFLYDIICTPGGVLLLTDPWCCSGDGTQYTRGSFTSTRAFDQKTISGNYLRITRYRMIDGIRTIVSDETTGTWVADCWDGTQRRGVYGPGGTSVVHPFVGCRRGPHGKYDMMYQISVPNTADCLPWFVEFFAEFAEQFCSFSYAINRYNRSFVSTGGSYVFPGTTDPAFSFSGQFLSYWTNEGLCGGGCWTPRVVLTGDPDVDPIDPGGGQPGVNPIPGDGTARTGMPEDAF